MTDEISGKPRVPVGELEELVEAWRENEIEPYGMNWQYPADELEALIERYDYE